MFVDRKFAGHQPASFMGGPEVNLLSLYVVDALHQVVHVVTRSRDKAGLASFFSSVYLFSVIIIDYFLFLATVS